MKSIDKRLDDLEKASGGKGVLKTIYRDDNRPGEYSEGLPIGEDRGKLYNEAEKNALALEYDDVMIIRIVGSNQNKR